MTGNLNFNELFAYTQNAKLGFSLEQGKSLNYYFALPNKLFDYMQSDDVKNTYNAVQGLSQKEQAIRDKWNAYLESPEGRYAKEGKSTIESFPEYQQFFHEYRQ